MTDETRVARRAVLGALGATAVGVAGCTAQPDAHGTEREREGATVTTSPDGAAVGANTETSAQSTAADGAETAYTRVYRETIESVVQILVPDGLGSGFVYGDDHVVTNYHVVGDYDRVQVQFRRGESITGTVVGTDPETDLVVIRVSNRPPYATPLSLVAADPVIGTRVAAIGSPYGLEGSLTTGVVSGVDRLVPSPNADFDIPDVIQTDAPVNPGNSGGPLVNLAGELLGIINAGGGNDIAFAISAPLVRRVVPSLIRDGDYRHPYLGVGLVAVTRAVARANGLDRSRGLLVANVVPGGPSESVLRPSADVQRVNGFEVPVGGDVVVTADGRPVDSLQELLSYLELETAPGETLRLGIVRDGEERTVQLTLGARDKFQ